MRYFLIGDAVEAWARVRRVACLARRGGVDWGVLMVLGSPEHEHRANEPGIPQTLPSAVVQLTQKPESVSLNDR